jgi:hypothetical protein
VEKKLITPQIFLERLLERLKDAKSLEPKKKKDSKGKDLPKDELTSILDEELRLINHLYGIIVRKSQHFSDKHAGNRHMTDIMISVSFSIFATTCLQVMAGDEIEHQEFMNVLQANLNKMFSDCGSDLVVSKK